VRAGRVALVTELGSFDFTTGSAFLIPVIAAAVLGGVGHPYGAMLGALVIGLRYRAGRHLLRPDLQGCRAFLVLIVVLLIRPQGIFAEVASQKESRHEPRVVVLHLHVLVYLGVDVMACWGLNLQYGYTGI